MCAPLCATTCGRCNARRCRAARSNAVRCCAVLCCGGSWRACAAAWRAGRRARPRARWSSDARGPHGGGGGVRAAWRRCADAGMRRDHAKAALDEVKDKMRPVRPPPRPSGPRSNPPCADLPALRAGRPAARERGGAEPGPASADAEGACACAGGLTGWSEASLCPTVAQTLLAMCLSPCQSNIILSP